MFNPITFGLFGVVIISYLLFSFLSVDSNQGPPRGSSQDGRRDKPEIPKVAAGEKIFVAALCETFYDQVDYLGRHQRPYPTFYQFIEFPDDLANKPKARYEEEVVKFLSAVMHENDLVHDLSFDAWLRGPKKMPIGAKGRLQCRMAAHLIYTRARGLYHDYFLSPGKNELRSRYYIEGICDQVAVSSRYPKED
ncbi:hypothetical protein GGTG_04948 [Gaeumannomyces tritici R3-111a-1]|uniref:Uncharacterized protein n=1 Tax=Gaeumannomyces tritici (strain R3-111a-1) TaxID=644352 RepID=J3NUJ2_GAET3|nr:hypothetical protein GGTG_04948 [Gaeumannomyces tritici R3-111a-1]EJT79865.1 hypothetical protein GGTG_04948 [Gaeumannomyces tritici R3-111a-1]